MDQIPRIELLTGWLPCGWLACRLGLVAALGAGLFVDMQTMTLHTRVVKTFSITQSRACSPIFSLEQSGGPLQNISSLRQSASVFNSLSLGLHAPPGGLHALYSNTHWLTKPLCLAANVLITLCFMLHHAVCVTRLARIKVPSTVTEGVGVPRNDFKNRAKALLLFLLTDDGVVKAPGPP